MIARRRRRTARSLRLNLSLWFLTVFSVLHVILLVAVVSLRRDLVHRANEKRIETSAQVMVDNFLLELQKGPEEWTEEALHPLLPHDADFEFFAIRHSLGGKVLVAHGVEGPENIPFTNLETVPAGPLGPVFSKVKGERARTLVSDAGTLGLLTLPFRHGGELYYFQAGVRGARLEGVLAPFLDLFLLGVPLAALAAFVAAWMISGRAVTPLLRLSRAAQDVSPSHLGARIRLETADQEVSAVQSELNLALGRLEAGYVAQEEFISNVSHELKTPIAILRSESQLLLNGTAAPESYRTFAASVEEETQRLARLVESFLTLARHGWTRELVHRSQIAAVDLVLDAVRHASLLADQHEVHLSPSILLDDPGGDSPIVAGDPALLGTMLENLLRNGIRFSPAGETVRIEVEANGEEVVLRVEDRGEGIPTELLGRIFQRHVGTTDAHGTRGAGIGLTIAKSIVELHSGRIEARNNDGRGCSFEVHLPRSAEDLEG